jgi:uncharacterized protein (TIGR00106 family)
MTGRGCSTTPDGRPNAPGHAGRLLAYIYLTVAVAPPRQQEARLRRKSTMITTNYSCRVFARYLGGLRDGLDVNLDHLPLAMKPLFKNVRHDRLGRTFSQPALQVDVEVTSEAGHPGDYAGRMLVAFSVTPLGTGEGVGEIVAEAVRVVRESGLANQTDSMFTTLEGDWDEVMAVVKTAVEAVAARAPRVSLVLKADIRPGVTDGLTSKVETIERYLDS